MPAQAGIHDFSFSVLIARPAELNPSGEQVGRRFKPALQKKSWMPACAGMTCVFGGHRPKFAFCAVQLRAPLMFGFSSGQSITY